MVAMMNSNCLLNKVNYTPEDDELILLGDYVDRGIKSRDVVRRVKELHEQFSVITLKGNHDDMMVKALTNNDESLDAHWLNNGGYQTVESYCGFDFSKNNLTGIHIRKPKNLYLIITTSTLIFLLVCRCIMKLVLTSLFMLVLILLRGLEKRPDDDYLWIRDIFINNSTGLDKTVVFGHTPCVHLHSKADIWFSSLGDKIGVDGACAYGSDLTAWR